jgi:cytochrome c biogenesis protein CcmG/thiol:disulfide interchange protein DsbE
LATRLDVVMNRLATQPIPTAEETLDRLINEILVLNAVENAPSPERAEVEARIEALAASWRISDDTITAALGDSHLSRADLSSRVGRLLQIESALNQLTAQNGDLNQWLQEMRANSKIGLYRSLGRVPGAAPATAESVITSSKAVTTDSAVAVEPAETFTLPPDLPRSPYPGNAAPDFSLPTLSSQPVTLNDLRGKPAIINFWATWCPPCRREMPALQSAFDRHRDEIGFVAVDVKEDAQKVADFVADVGLTFPVVLDRDGRVSDVAYQVRGIPTTIFIDASGVVVERHVGPLDDATIEAYLTPLLSPPVASVDPPATADDEAIALLKPQVEDAAAPNANSDQPALGVNRSLPVAPDFDLITAAGDPVSLRDYIEAQQSVVLVFYRGHT